MDLGWREAMIGFAVAFAVFLVFKVRPARKRRAALGDVAAARERARVAATPRDRAVALVDAGRHAAAARRWTSAAGLFLRAMKADPTHAGAIVEAAAALGSHRSRWLEAMLWRRLDHLPWEGEHAAAARAAAEGLADLYARRRRDRGRAAVMRRLAARI